VRGFAIEGTGTYGAGLTRHLQAADVFVIEATRPRRDKMAQRNDGKSDSIADSKNIQTAKIEIAAAEIPTYKLAGRAALYFAGWKAHYSLYPATPLVLETFGDELSAYQVKKGTIRFPLGEAVPSKLIERIAKLRGKELKKAKAPR
jgi:uncharacterized protein YdhG (YjbR/CyaY superfamily)